MALTDHDCMKGVPEFLAEASQIGLHGIPGVELSAEVPVGQLHLVGLGFNYHDTELSARFERLLNGRAERNQAMLTAFQHLGIDLTDSEVRAFAGDELVSRVHFAQALIARGLAIDIKDAFARFLGKGACCYRDRFRYTPSDCIAMLRNAGGIAVMAHPLSLDQNLTQLELKIKHLRDLGLEAMECFYSTYDTETTLELLRIAKRLDLLPSIGSDFHGAPKPTIHLGHLSASPKTELRWMERLSI